MDSIGQSIKDLRKLKSWSQEKLARELGVSLNTVQRWEMGKTNPSPLAKEKILKVMKEVFNGDQIKLF